MEQMEFTYQFLLSIGGMFLVGQAVSVLGHKTLLPRVTLLLIFGAVIGEGGLNLMPSVFIQWFEIVAEMTLMMVGFLIGGKLTLDSISKDMNKIFWVSSSAAVLTTVFVFVALMLMGMEFEIALVLGCIASATAPAATLDVVMEYGKHSRFGELLISIVAIDDAWALLLFGVGISLATSVSGLAGESSAVLMAARDIGGAILLGALIGFPAAFLTGRFKPGEPILTEALGLVFICGGLAIWLDVSFLIASIVMGAVVANFARHHDYPFHAIENIEWPFMVIFFVLAGATLKLEALSEIGWFGLAYIVGRLMGKVIGAGIGCQLSRAGDYEKRWMGIAMLPQAGVPIGMALVASNSFPESRDMLLSITLGTTVIFEIVGPLFTRIAVQKAPA